MIYSMWICTIGVLRVNNENLFICACTMTRMNSHGLDTPIICIIYQYCVTDTVIGI